MSIDFADLGNEEAGNTGGLAIDEPGVDPV